MDKNLFNNNLDDFLRKSYENHTIEPDRALWEKINMRLYQRKTYNNLRKVRHVRIAIASLVVVLVSTFIYFEIKTQKYQPKAPLTSGTPESPVDTIKENNKLPATQVQLSGPSKNFEYDKNVNSDSLNNHKFSSMTTGIEDSSIMKTNNFNELVKTVTSENLEPLSLKFSIPSISTIPFIYKPRINESVNLQIDSSIVIAQVSQKQDKGESKSPGLSQSLTQKGELSSTRSEVKRFPLFIEGFVSPEISYRALVENTKYSMPDYGKTYFNKNEQADFTFSTGVMGGVGITKNMILRTGIFYSTYSYKFKTEAIHLINTGADGNLIYTSSGLVNLPLVSSDTLSNESLLKSSMNFSYLNIPLIAELHFANNYFINLGVNFNILIGQNMNWQSEDYDGNFSDIIGYPIDGLETGSISMIVGFGTEKPITRNLSLIINPLLKIYLTSINNTTPVKSFPYLLGLNAGLRYYLN